MKIFVWGTIAGITDCYHGGGVVVVAATLEEARRLLRAYPGVQDDCEAFTEAPHVIIHTTVHPTGCC